MRHLKVYPWKDKYLEQVQVLDSNLSFFSVNGDGDRFWTMFSDSKIGGKYSQNERKISM